MGGSRGTLRVYRRVLIQVETTALGTDGAGETRRNLTRRQLPGCVRSIRDFLSPKNNDPPTVGQEFRNSGNKRHCVL